VHNCGFGGGVDAIIRMCMTYKIDIPEEMLEPIVKNWRIANPKIVKLWKACQAAAVMCIQNGTRIMLSDMRDYQGNILVDVERGICFEFVKGHMLIRLPSGRRLCYWNAGLEDGKYGKEVIYYGLNQVTKQWCKQRTYSGKLAENLTQAIARDCLASGLINLHRAGIRIPAHVHDESVPEVKKGSITLERINELMCKKVRWMKDLPLEADGFKSDYYKKEA